ncbi:hypothetical protein [Streptacidiphilus sp. PB12-B1b]|uniref:hypothetical protein n=1 Tax=Streptacidiphilus sp. PB12-B1b TaxID=2705012 RepID=UPI001CDD4DB1|nr:hypothetical protein [Streptacidiphilus sp. PB12-B1b]
MSTEALRTSEAAPGAAGEALVVVFAVESGPDGPGRPVAVGGTVIGSARNYADVERLIDRAGLADLVRADPTIVAWRGGDPDRWS